MTYICTFGDTVVQGSSRYGRNTRPTGSLAGAVFTVRLAGLLYLLLRPVAVCVSNLTH
jgi:hypothetical protein